jgi:hypothetical protein
MNTSAWIATSESGAPGIAMMSRSSSGDPIT